MPRYLVLFLGLSVLSITLTACEELPEAVVKRNSALQGSMGWSDGFAPLPPLSEPAPPAQANTSPGFTDLPALPFQPLNPLPEPSPAQTEEAPPATPNTPTSPAPDSSPAAGDTPIITASQTP